MKKHKELNLYFQALPNYEVRNETLEDKEYLVVPVVMMVEGVHSGSRGPLLHLAEELGHVPGSWNGIPVTIHHPQDEEGQFVSANSPEILTSWAVGKIFNTRMDGNKLIAEAWVETEKLEQLSPETLASITAMEIIEVSVGVFSDEEEEAGEYQGEAYTAIARNHKPDHLALLPGEVGACSIEDGCGVRVYKLKERKGVESKVTVNADNVSEVSKELNTLGYSVIPVTYQESLGDVVSLVRRTLYAMDSNVLDHYVEEVYNTYVVYRLVNDADNTTKLYKRNYTITNTNTVEWVGEPAQVSRETNYVPVSPITQKRKRTKFNNHKNNVENMEKCTECIKDKAGKLIAHAKTNYTEENRTWLETLEESQLDAMMPVVEEPKKEPVVNTKKDWLEGAPEDVKEEIRVGLALHKERKTKMATDIIANTAEGTWTEKELLEMEFETLSKIYKSTPAKEELADYSLNNAVTTFDSSKKDEIKPMFPTGYKSNEKKS